MSVLRLTRACGLLAAVSTVFGCGSVAISESDSEVAQSSQAAVALENYLYLRCNATGWGADNSTRLAASGPGVYSIEYNVAASYMVSGGDQCVITQTNAAGGWGTVSASFGTSSTAAISVPGQWSVGPVNSAMATIRYPALGRYRADVNWTTKTVSITPITAEDSSHYYLRCNATGWIPTSQNRLADANGKLGLTFAVNQSWMVSQGDSCVVTRTNQLDGWGTIQTAFGSASAAPVVVPAGGGVNAALVSGGQQFTVRYPALGNYQAVFEPTTGQLRIMVPGSDVPETGLHGAVQSLGENRVRVTYDFQSAEQLQDFVPANSGTTAVSLRDGRLLVEPTVGSGGILAAKLVKGFKVDSIRYQAELVSGDHINVYVGTRWDDNWDPSHGYGAIHRGDGRVFVANGLATSTSATDRVLPGTVYTGRIDATEQGLTWTVDGNAQSVATAYYGGTTRTVALGGFASTVAFDNLVLEGTVEGFESDGTELNPNVNHGNVSNLPDGRVRIAYDFSDPQQKYDFITNSSQATRREINDGRLIVSLAGGESALKVVRYKYKMRVDSLTYQAEALAGDHVNVYLNTIWDGNWNPAVGCGGIHRSDGRIIVNNGSVSATSDTNPMVRRMAYTGSVVLSPSAIDWVLNGGSVSLESPCYSGLDGTFALGSYQSDVAFDNVVIEGQLQ